MEHVILTNTIVPSGNNSPTREGEVVNSVTDIPNIELPYIGMPVFVLDEWKLYRVKTLNGDLDRCVNYVEDSSGDVAGVFKWKGEKNSVEDLDNETSTAQSGDTWSVKDSGNYCFVPESVKLSLNDSSKEVPQGFASAFRKNDDGTISIEVSPNKFETATMVKKSNDPDNYDYYLISQEGKQYVYYNNGIGTQMEGGSDAIVMTIVSSHWMPMGGNAVTKAEVENSINNAKSEVSNILSTSLEGKQNTLSSTQLAAVNSGITATILSELQDGCLASADEANGLIKVKISGTDGYMYVQAAKLEAPETPDFIGDMNIYATSEVVKIGAECETEGAVIRYSVGDNEVTESSPVMTEAGVGLIQDALEDKYENGVQLKVNIRAFKYGIGSSTFSRTFTIYRKIENPTITIKSGTTDYDSPRYIKITVPVGTTVRYTTNGDTPTTTSGTIYSGEFWLAKTSEETYTVKAIAYREGWSRSGEESKSVTINKTPEVRFGFSTKTGATGNTWSGNAEIESILTNVKKGITSMAGGNNYVATPATDSYVWFAVLKSSNITISKDPANTSGFGSLALQKSGSSIKRYNIGDYYLYRADSLMASGKQMSVKF